MHVNPWRPLRPHQQSLRLPYSTVRHIMFVGNAGVIGHSPNSSGHMELCSQKKLRHKRFTVKSSPQPQIPEVQLTVKDMVLVVLKEINAAIRVEVGYVRNGSMGIESVQFPTFFRSYVCVSASGSLDNRWSWQAYLRPLVYTQRVSSRISEFPITIHSSDFNAPGLCNCCWESESKVADQDFEGGP